MTVSDQALLQAYTMLMKGYGPLPQGCPRPSYEEVQAEFREWLKLFEPEIIRLFKPLPSSAGDYLAMSATETGNVPTRTVGTIIEGVLSDVNFEYAIRDSACTADIAHRLKAHIPEMRKAIKYALGWEPTIIRAEVRQGPQAFMYELVFRVGKPVLQRINDALGQVPNVEMFSMFVRIEGCPG